MRVIASAPGKVILFGEHFVVYGEPAIVMAVDRRVRVAVEPIEGEDIHILSKDLNLEGVFRGSRYLQLRGEIDGFKVFKPIVDCIRMLMCRANVKLGLKVEIESQIPIAAGLGSSAALLVALVAATSRVLGLNLGLKDINTFAYEGEKIVHGKPSGIDNTTSTYGGIILYRRTNGNYIFKQLKVKVKIPIVVANTGTPRSTRDMVLKVKRLYEEQPEIFRKLMETYEVIANKALKAIQEGDLKLLGKLMKINHGLLWSLGVSTVELDNLVYEAIKLGAYGAKLTGAGGGGCMIALTPEDRVDRIIEGLKSMSANVTKVLTDTEGVKVEVEG